MCVWDADLEFNQGNTITNNSNFYKQTDIIVEDRTNHNKTLKNELSKCS